MMVMAAGAPIGRHEVNLFSLEEHPRALHKMTIPPPSPPKGEVTLFDPNKDDIILLSSAVPRHYERQQAECNSHRIVKK